jgi:hypothetical protein
MKECLSQNLIFDIFGNTLHVYGVESNIFQIKHLTLRFTYKLNTSSPIHFFFQFEKGFEDLFHPYDVAHLTMQHASLKLGIW